MAWPSRNSLKVSYGGHGTIGSWPEPASLGHDRRAMNRLTARLLVVALTVLVAVGAVGVVRASSAGCNLLSRSPCVRVLFLGNSFTYVNDLPSVFHDLARSAGQNVETSMVAGGGETLAQHATSSDSLNAINGTHWQFVVIQEQSQIPSVESFRQSQMYPAVRALAGDIWQAHATPILLETWAHRDGWSDERLDYAAMQAGVDQAYATIGAELRITIAPAGQAWQAVRQMDPAIDLWQADGIHPSVAGTYLAACSLYTRLFGPCPLGGSYTDGLPPATAQILAEIANRY